LKVDQEPAAETLEAGLRC